VAVIICEALVDGADVHGQQGEGDARAGGGADRDDEEARVGPAGY